MPENQIFGCDNLYWEDESHNTLILISKHNSGIILWKIKQNPASPNRCENKHFTYIYTSNLQNINIRKKTTINPKVQHQ